MLFDGCIMGVSEVGFSQLYDDGEIFPIFVCVLTSIVYPIILEVKLFRLISYVFVNVL